MSINVSLPLEALRPGALSTPSRPRIWSSRRRRIRRPGRHSFAGLLAACVIEARPRVQVIFFLRLLAGSVLGRSAGVPVSIGRLLAVAVVWELAVLSVYLLDGVMDIVEDRLNGSTRPIARGALPRGFATAVTLCASGLALVGAVLLGGPYPLLVGVMLVLGFVYCCPPLRLKRWSGSAGVTVTIAGILTFVAGDAAYGHVHLNVPLMVFAGVMSAWMGLVGALAKDFSDIEGDAAAGCRTIALLRHHRAVWLVACNALSIAITFVVLARLAAPVLVWPAVVMVIGASMVAATTTGASPVASRSVRRRPYNAFMLTQYAVHAAVFVGALLPLG